MDTNKRFIFWRILPVIALACPAMAEKANHHVSGIPVSQVLQGIEVHSVENPTPPFPVPFESSGTSENGTASVSRDRPSEHNEVNIVPEYPKRSSAAPTNFPNKPLSPPAPLTHSEPKIENGTVYLCGGIGLDEADYMKQAAKNYDLMLTFAAKAGNYLANINVAVLDSQGKSILKTICDAPMLLVNFPRNGTYQIHAEAGGRTVTRTFNAKPGEAGKTVTLIWPEK